MGDRYRRLQRGEANAYESVEQLRALSEQELVSKYDAWMAHANKRPPSDKTALTNRAQIYMNELMRRETQRQGERMEALTRETISQGKRLEDLTRSLNLLTVVITVATIIGVALTAWTLLSGA